MLTPEDAAARYKIALSRPNSGTKPGTKKRSA
jgi:hypothetical protein